MYSIKESLSIVWVCSQPADSPGPSHATRQAPTNSQHASTAGGNNATPTKCKRPMNAFMLFAKKFRVEYTQMYPGKDNRWVGSVPTGVLWSCQCWCNFKCVCVRMCVFQSDQRPPRWAMEENAKRGAAGVHRAGQSSRRRTEEAQPRLLETQTNQLGKELHTISHTHTHTHTHTQSLTPCVGLLCKFLLCVQQGCQGN